MNVIKTSELKERKGGREISNTEGNRMIGKKLRDWNDGGRLKTIREMLDNRLIIIISSRNKRKCQEKSNGRISKW